MAGILNHDSSFFDVQTVEPITGIPLGIDQTVISKDVRSLSITEEGGKMMNGTLELRDPNHIYSHALRNGVGLKLEWGYKNFDLSPLNLLKTIENPTEFQGAIARSNIRAMITSPSGGGDNKGTLTYNCNFQAHMGTISERKNRVFSIGTKGTVITQVLLEMGVIVINQHVLFKRMAEPLTPDTSVRMGNETLYRFLSRMAREWGAHFLLGQTPTGLSAAVFADPDKVSSIPFAISVLGGVGKSNLFEYKDGVRNVKSYKWKQNVGENGAGDNVRISYVNGQPVLLRTMAINEKVLTWKLDTDAIKRDFKRRSNPIEQMKVYRSIATATDFEEVKKYFTPVESSTAPQGAGYNINIETYGNVLLTAYNEIGMGRGFPTRLRQGFMKFFIKKVTHTINRKGYDCSLDIQDNFSSLTGSLIGI